MLSGKLQKIGLILSYAFDWIILIAAAAVATVLGDLTPNKRPFSLVDLSISFPHTHETISTTLLMICSLIIPAAIIFVVSLALSPGSTTPEPTPKAQIWRRKLWEWHAGWLGLALSLAAAWVLTSSSKNLFGKPRPDLIARCQPDIPNISDYVIGGYDDLKEGALLVSADICKNNDTGVLNDGFRSFPSGHSSFSAAGLVYLTLFLAAKLGSGIPFLSHGSHSSNTAAVFPTPEDRSDDSLSARRSAASPPLYLLLITALPTLAAIYITSTRFFDFRHHGFDCLFGFFIGLVTARFAYSYYHLPVSRGAGWAWGVRGKGTAFWKGVGREGFASVGRGVTEVPKRYAQRSGDIEMTARSFSEDNEHMLGHGARNH